EASPDAVWNVLKQFERYPDWIDSVQATEVYRRKGDRIDVSFRVRAAGLSFEYSVAHRFRDRERYATWRLDEARSSDLAGSVGMWKVDAVPGAPGASLVTYSVELDLGHGVPGALRRLLVARGLAEATEWVREASAG
ncbi:MAG: SRPBCC family protein, partial [Myxococcota bacterium]